MNFINRWWAKKGPDFLHVVLMATLIFVTADAWESRGTIKELSVSMGVKSTEMVWVKAQRDVLRDIYITGKAHPVSIEEQIVLTEYQELKGTLDREWTIAEIQGAIHTLTKGRYKTKFYDKIKVHFTAGVIYDAAKEFDVPIELVVAIGFSESRYRDDVCMGYKDSSMGALGCMQIMPLWVKELSFVDDEEQLRFDPVTNFRAGAAILKHYMDHPDVNRYENPILAALRMYNYGAPSYNARKRKGLDFNGYAMRVIRHAVQIKKQMVTI